MSSLSPEEHLKDKSFPICICPQCKDTTNYIEEYEKHYCPNCNADVEPILERVNYSADALVAVQKAREEEREETAQDCINVLKGTVTTGKFEDALTEIHEKMTKQTEARVRRETAKEFIDFLKSNYITNNGFIQTSYVHITEKELSVVLKHFLSEGRK